MKRTIGNILIIIYIVLAIAITMCLLNFNEYKITEFGDYSLIILTDDELNPEYSKGDLIIVHSTDNIELGQNAFFYNTYDSEMTIILAEVQAKDEVTSTETTYTLDGDYKISSEYLLGAEATATVIPKLGSVLKVLESKWGFLFLVVLPSLLAFLYEIATIATEIITGNKENDANEETEE